MSDVISYGRLPQSLEAPLLKAQHDIYRARAAYQIASSNLAFARVHRFNVDLHEEAVLHALDGWRRSQGLLACLLKLRGLK